jgi:PHS family inorganic phosphate transporter-like MFS transporter
MIAAVFAMQGFGILSAGIVALIVLLIFKGAVLADQNNLDYVWRLCIGIGAIPACIAIYFRLTIPETPRYTIECDQNVDQAVNDVNAITDRQQNAEKKETVVKLTNENTKATFSEFCRHFSKWKHFKVLLATSGCWFALDVAFYGINLNSGIIIQAIGFSGSVNGANTTSEQVWNSLYNNAGGNIIIALMGTVPGYW